MTPAGESAAAEGDLLDVVDRLLGRGIAIRGELWLTVADVELLFVGMQVVVAPPERMHAERGGPTAAEAPS
jgi:hypothetical protein